MSALAKRRGGKQPTGYQLDQVLLGAAGTLLLLGLVMVGSASIALAEREYGDALHLLRRQVLFAGVGLLAAGVAFVTPMDWWRRSSFVLVALALGLLGILLVPGVGHEVNGAVRWLPVGPFKFQVSELARVLLIMYLAGYVARHGEDLESSFSGFVKPLIIIALACGLLLAEPDFGAATVLLATALGMLFIGGVRLRDFATLFTGAVAAMAAIAAASPYRLRRLTGFVDPWADPYDSGFQLTQSLIAVGRGEWLGVGLGDGVQKLFYLPEAHTDFVFAVLAEELGLVGVILTLALFGVLVWRALRLGRQAGEAGLVYQSHLACGLGLWLGLQACINVGVTLGVLPTKGLTLPLLSYGGSSLITTLLSLGLLMRVHHETVLATPSGRNRRRAK